MDHLSPFRPRKRHVLDTAHENGWQIKRYAIVADGRTYDPAIAAAATAEAVRRLPEPGPLTAANGNHGAGFQIIHFAEGAVVSPMFYWQWSSVLAQMGQLRAAWETPTRFADGMREVVGCVWEMQIVQHEVTAWTDTMLGSATADDPAQRLSRYMSLHADT